MRSKEKSRIYSSSSTEIPHPRSSSLWALGKEILDGTNSIASMLKYVVFSGSQEWRTAHSPSVGRVWWDLDPAIRATETPERLDKAQTVGGRLAPHLYPRPFKTHVFRVRTENNTKAQLGTFGILEPRWTIKYRVSNGTARRIEQ